MTKTLIALSIAIVTLTGASAAMAAGKARPKTCASFSELSGPSGKVGVCAPSKAGGKPTYLRSYQIVTITGDDGVKTQVMIGFR